MMKKIAMLGFISGAAMFLYGRKLLAQARTTGIVRADMPER